MSETKQLVADLDKKVDQLLSNLNEATASQKNKDQEIMSLKDQLSTKDELIKTLEKEKNQVKDTPTAAPTKDSEEIKVRINELVKEIDNCISLLKV